jgi:L-aminopeptidase/D-esterase-like protein
MWEAAAPVGTGPQNSITDVSGLLVGHHERLGGGWCTGVTVVVAPEGAVAGVDVRGGGPGTRETDLLAAHNVVEHVHAVLLAGGSAYGLDAAGGVMRWLEEHDIGYRVGDGRGEVVPIVPAAVLYDLRAGDFAKRPDAAFGYAACAAATARPVAQGCVGAGTGAQAGPLKGGIGTASTVLDGGITVGALVAVNSRGHVADPHTGALFGGALALPGEFDDLPVPSAAAAATARDRLEATKKMAKLNTTVGVVATDARLTKAECRKVAEMAHDGLARAIRPIHTLFDGDTIFALATGICELAARDVDEYGVAASRSALLNDLGAAGADAVARAIVHAALAAVTTGGVPSYTDAYGLHGPPGGAGPQ